MLNGVIQLGSLAVYGVVIWKTDMAYVFPVSVLLACADGFLIVHTLVHWSAEYGAVTGAFQWKYYAWTTLVKISVVAFLALWSDRTEVNEYTNWIFIWLVPYLLLASRSAFQLFNDERAQDEKEGPPGRSLLTGASLSVPQMLFVDAALAVFVDLGDTLIALDLVVALGRVNSVFSFIVGSLLAACCFIVWFLHGTAFPTSSSDVLFTRKAIAMTSIWACDIPLLACRIACWIVLPGQPGLQGLVGKNIICIALWTVRLSQCKRIEATKAAQRHKELSVINVKPGSSIMMADASTATHQKTWNAQMGGIASEPSRLLMRDYNSLPDQTSTHEQPQGSVNPLAAVMGNYKLRMNEKERRHHFWQRGWTEERSASAIIPRASLFRPTEKVSVVASEHSRPPAVLPGAEKPLFPYAMKDEFDRHLSEPTAQPRRVIKLAPPNESEGADSTGDGDSKKKAGTDFRMAADYVGGFRTIPVPSLGMITVLRASLRSIMYGNDHSYAARLTHKFPPATAFQSFRLLLPLLVHYGCICGAVFAMPHFRDLQQGIVVAMQPPQVLQMTRLISALCCSVVIGHILAYAWLCPIVDVLLSSLMSCCRLLFWIIALSGTLNGNVTVSAQYPMRDQASPWVAPFPPLGSFVYHYVDKNSYYVEAAKRTWPLWWLLIVWLGDVPIVWAVLTRAKYMRYRVVLPRRVDKELEPYLDASTEETLKKLDADAGFVSLSSVLMLKLCRTGIAPLSLHARLISGLEVIEAIRLTDYLHAYGYGKFMLQAAVVMFFTMLQLNLWLIPIVSIAWLVFSVIAHVMSQAHRLISLRALEVKEMFAGLVSYNNRPDENERREHSGFFTLTDVDQHYSKFGFLAAPGSIWKP